MKISSRFSIAVHIVLTIAIIGGKQKLTSDFLASCINVNPVVIRRILGQLKKAGIVDVKPGEGGASLLKNPADLSLFEIYQAVDIVEDVSLFNSHRQPDVKCPVECGSCPKKEFGISADCVVSGVSDVSEFCSGSSSVSESCAVSENSFDEPAGGNEDCCYIHSNIVVHLQTAQQAMEDSLKSTTIGQMILELSESPNTKN